MFERIAPTTRKRPFVAGVGLPCHRDVDPAADDEQRADQADEAHVVEHRIGAAPDRPRTRA
jgi:hypothetical protein